MKTMINKSLLFILLLSFFSTITFGQSDKAAEEKAKIEQIKNLLKSKKFVFEARNVSPMRGGFVPLTSPYDVVVRDSSVRSFLPYFGRAFSAPMNPSEGPLQFTSEKFDYEMVEKKKGRHVITIEPKDVNQVRQMILSVTETGYATLSVSSNNRDPISFNGIVRAIEEE
ncbi:DUF4251 domain-containing protein [Pedobacter sp. SYSU D00535]|uniref:DUF4251 domain-containing protein n=1 Tax=Pedobacter sp. SYSU D00535 TaxID=2810308 RepID=UPI001A95D49F|nr:DUF4251 domain-containing protein [Pedobacter sp. SYSU D00535]